MLILQLSLSHKNYDTLKTTSGDLSMNASEIKRAKEMSLALKSISQGRAPTTAPTYSFRETPKVTEVDLMQLRREIMEEVSKSVPTLDEMIQKIKSEQLLGLRDIKGMPINMNDMRWHGGGISSVTHDATLTGSGTASSPLSVVGSGLAIITVTGTVNDSNTSFTSATQPTVLVINGGVYQRTGGIITWTWVATVITLSSAVGTGGSIFGL